MGKQYILKQTDFKAPNLSIDYRKELNDEQFAAVTQSEGPSLVLAGAGSGKTRTLVYRVAYMIESGVSPDRILLMTFTNKAAKEMVSRVESLLKSTPKGLWGGTFHHVGNRVLRMYGKAIGIDSNFVILDSEDSKDLIKVSMSEASVPKDKYFPKAEAIHKIISLSSNLGQTVGEVIAESFSYCEEPVIAPIEKVAEIYQQKKRSSQSLDYDDLLLLWNDLMEKSEEVRNKLQQKFQYILVDEYQDTNYIQAKIVAQLAALHSNVMAVGDDSQSIYSFRGATVDNILAFPKIFTNAKVFKLETNYRSTPEILAFANASISKNLNQFEKKLKTSKDSSHKPVLAALDDSQQQADFICQRILELREEGIDLNDMAVLFRAHFHSLELEIALSKRGIPYEMRGGLRFFEQAHIKDVVAHIKAFASINDEIAWRRVLRLQPSVGEVTAQKIWQTLAKAGNLQHALKAPLSDMLSTRVFESWQRLEGLWHKMIAIGQDNIATLISEVRQYGYDRHVKENFDNFQDRLDDLDQLVDYAASYEKLEQFLADVALSEGFKGQTITGYQDGPTEAITLSTVHQAKGLEWKVVFVIGLAQGHFPHAKVFDKPNELEEERRLFYVSATRAKDQLYLTYPIFNSRGDTFNRPSVFIEELPKNIYEKWEIQKSGLSKYADLGDEDVEYVDEERGSILDKYF